MKSHPSLQITVFQKILSKLLLENQEFIFFMRPVFITGGWILMQTPKTYHSHQIHILKIVGKLMGVVIK